ncbi:MAG TPA: hypothetical protein VGA78_14650 [Gemmatimonadales bacterium]|jgi:hypothetical protein
MPVTARLSRKFYETFGDEVTNELVEWLNMVDATYRADLRELNELNFARFDARLEQRVAELDAKLEQRMTRLEAGLEQRFAGLEAGFERLRVEFRAELRAELAAQRAEMIKWSFLFWIGMVVTVFVSRLI